MHEHITFSACAAPDGECDNLVCVHTNWGDQLGIVDLEDSSKRSITDTVTQFISTDHTSPGHQRRVSETQSGDSESESKA